MNEPINYEYAGFWIRFVAMLIDTVAVSVVIAVIYILTATLGSVDFKSIEGIVDIAVIAIVIAMWVWFGATPGKMVLNLTIIDEVTGKPPSFLKCIIRYVGFLLAIMMLFVGVLWIFFDTKKKGFHDHLAGTAVIKNNH